jgi:hypothetical protein
MLCRVLTLTASFYVAYAKRNAFYPSKVSCGSWGEDYTTFFRSQVRNHSAPRLIYVPEHSGLADKLLGMSAAFLLAMLTDRVFGVADSFGFRLKDYFQFPNIDLSQLDGVEDDFVYAADFLNHNKMADSGIIPDPLRVPSSVKKPPQIDHKEYDLKVYDMSGIDLSTNSRLIYLSEGNKTAALKLCLDPDRFRIDNEGIITIYIRSNKGVIYNCVKNNIMKAILDKIGLNSENAFPCIMKYLVSFEKRNCSNSHQTVANAFESARLNQKSVIGIHIRTGDSYLLNGVAPNFTVAKPFFKCAQDIAQSIAQKSSLYYVISDSRNLLLQINETFGKQSIINLNAAPRHVGIHVKSSILMNGSYNLDVLHTLCDLYYFSDTDFQILSRNSGFGMVGAALKPRELRGRLYRFTAARGEIDCRSRVSKSPAITTDVDKIVRMWSGL